MLNVVELTKSYGTRTLFEEVTFSMAPRERLGLVGRNGCGKSTLFKLILAEESPDSGRISFPKGYVVGHLAQHLNFTESSILKEVCLGLPEEERDQEYRGEIILAGLGFSEEDMLKAPAMFSGGFQIRLNLAKLLLSEPNLLLLDEPTNYLDIVSVRWLISFLRSWKGELIIISHDRLFMDEVTTHTMLIHRGGIKKVSGGTEKIYSQVELDEEIYEKTRLNQDKKRKDLELFINRFRAKASKAALVQSKVKVLEKMGQSEELVDEATLDFRFCDAPFPGKQMVEVKDLSFAYPNGPTLIDGLSIKIEKNDRIGIIGKNGKGKSTLLRLFAGELTPQKGSISSSQNARVGYFGQSNISRLAANLTVEQEVTNANTSLHRTKVRAICGTMMFSGDDALKKVSVLSGGEKSRVLLGKILAQPTNFLLLDEPTNHLDMESIEALIESLKTYQGAVVIVTHSELLLREVAQRLVVFQGSAPHVFEHGYDYFLEKEGWSGEAAMSRTNSKEKKSQKISGPKTERELSKEAEKELKSLEKKIFETENAVSKLETLSKKIEEELAQASQTGNISQITSLAFKLKENQAEIAEMYSQWEKLSEKCESIRAVA
ncbi:MAG: ABC-F family ATP-binding cassette domain-containing protein [bacterium]|nr:ABC-F family ATP-binding cassette domain-containing protein [bacterium]